MNCLPAVAVPDSLEVDAAIERACARIAPSFPLDRLIAVNPLHGWTGQPFEQAAARLQSLIGSRIVMPRAWYREQLRLGRIEVRHLRAAAERAGAGLSVPELVDLLERDAAEAPRRELVSDVADRVRDSVHRPRWSEFVTHAISQFCAAYFDQGQAVISPDRTEGLYRSWRSHAARDLTPRLLMGLRELRSRVRLLPEHPRELVRQTVMALGIPAAEVENYLTALLLSVNGWAAWCAYQSWQARLDGRTDEHIVEFLAIRLAWDWLLFDADVPRMQPAWRDAIAAWPARDAQAEAVLATELLFQDALEIAGQEQIAGGLVAFRAERATEVPDAQVAFCIDVRSEVFRRALEAASGRIETHGVAGFFGLPADYLPPGAVSSRPQLPGLFAPRVRITDAGADAGLVARRTRRLQLADAWQRFRAAPVSTFPFVETGGLLYAVKLLVGSLGLAKTAPPDRTGLGAAARRRLKPRLAGRIDGTALTGDERVDFAAGLLRAMSLTRGFGRLLVLVGHGSTTTNNPLAGALDCGACGGHTGEVNARAMAALLNDAALRAGLAQRGIEIPATTHVLAGLHDTMTDDVTLFDVDAVPGSHRDDAARLIAALREAGRRCRAERATLLRLPRGNDAAIHAALRRRTRDWSQVRPEWGLANCAALIVAPRAHCRHLDLAGRAFLHDYRWQDDADLGVLSLILTGPMIVTHWINMQYYASTVDNRRFGSGNKALHNVVGGRIGVFEGNGGDLRIGLPLQSLHDGERWMHEPLRLSVFVEAPAAAIDAVLARNAETARLADNGWLHLFRCDGATRTVWRRSRAGQWLPTHATNE